MRPDTRDALVARLGEYDRLVEVGIGRTHAVAAALVAGGASVTATDVHPVEGPPGVDFVVDDIVVASERDDPGEVYDADAIYALNLPPELHRATWRVARAVDADLLFTTLGGDQPAIPVRRETLPGETLYHADR